VASNFSKGKEMNKTARSVYINLKMRIIDIQKIVDDKELSLSTRNDYNNIITGLTVAKETLIREFKLDESSMDQYYEEVWKRK
jgi:hypothetical protein